MLIIILFGGLVPVRQPYIFNSIFFKSHQKPPCDEEISTQYSCGGLTGHINFKEDSPKSVDPEDSPEISTQYSRGGLTGHIYYNEDSLVEISTTQYSHRGLTGHTYSKEDSPKSEIYSEYIVEDSPDIYIYSDKDSPISDDPVDSVKTYITTGRCIPIEGSPDIDIPTRTHQNHSLDMHIYTLSDVLRIFLWRTHQVTEDSIEILVLLIKLNDVVVCWTLD